jgi:hypothetical protein
MYLFGFGEIDTNSQMALASFTLGSHLGDDMSAIHSLTPAAPIALCLSSIDTGMQLITILGIALKERHPNTPPRSNLP